MNTYLKTLNLSCPSCKNKLLVKFCYNFNLSNYCSVCDVFILLHISSLYTEIEIALKNEYRICLIDNVLKVTSNTYGFNSFIKDLNFYMFQNKQEVQDNLNLLYQKGLDIINNEHLL